MSTHGCLKISDRDQRFVLLHTPHSGYLIPEIARLGVGWAAIRRVSGWLLCRDDLRQRYIDFGRQEFGRVLGREHSIPDGLDWPPAVAGWCVGCKPNVLVPIPASFVLDLADWSGIEEPYELVLESETQWVLRDQDSGPVLWEINPFEEAHDAVWADLTETTEGELTT